MKNINFDLSSGEYCEHLLDEEMEIKRANSFEFYPIPPITITDVFIDMPDDYRGNVKIKLSNGEEVEYVCEELRMTNMGPSTKQYVTVNRPGNTGYQICGDEFLENYAGSGSWVTDIMNCYMNYHKK